MLRHRWPRSRRQAVGGKSGDWCTAYARGWKEAERQAVVMSRSPGFLLWRCTLSTHNNYRASA
ncbi:hypothetical protein NCGM1179_1037 [Pseudomonas aeruginosa NCMG1179]|nr:hypothetical protein NCGM1179_1037 [Pseudomonas aeruginosa NCMG1179]